MITIKRIQDSIVERLKAVMPKVHVEAFPADFKTFLKSFRHVNGAILVQYVRTQRQYVSERSGTQVVQMEIVVIRKDLREHDGTYNLLDAAFVALSGSPLTEKYPTETRKLGVTLYLKDEEFQDYLQETGLWVYTQQYESAPFPFILSEEETTVRITELSVEMSNNELVIIPEPTE